MHIIMELCSGGDLVSNGNRRSSSSGSSGSTSCCGVAAYQTELVSCLGSSVAYFGGWAYTTLRSTAQHILALHCSPRQILWLCMQLLQRAECCQKPQRERKPIAYMAVAGQQGC